MTRLVVAAAFAVAMVAGMPAQAQQNCVKWLASAKQMADKETDAKKKATATQHIAAAEAHAKAKADNDCIREAHKARQALK